MFIINPNFQQLSIQIYIFSIVYNKTIMIIPMPEKKNSQLLNDNTHFIQPEALEYREFCSNSEKIVQKLPETRVTGKWSKSEDQIYSNFLIENRDRLSTQSLRRSTKIFKQLSDMLGNKRSPQQCRMHHNKMNRYSKKLNIDSIINFIRKKHKLPLYNQNKKHKRVKDGKKQLHNQIPITNKSQKNFYQIEEGHHKVQVETHVSIKIDLKFLSTW